MEQKDYILREIEKIRQIISAIRQKLLKENQNLAIGIETKKNNVKELFLNELKIELEEFLRACLKIFHHHSNGSHEYPSFA